MSHKAGTILIVDDEPDIGLALTMLLEDAGYTVVAVDTGDGLMERLRARGLPDLILLDMLLAGRDGREIAGELKAEQATRHIPILMMSAHPRAAQEAADAGADGFLAKPFELDAVLAQVAAYLA